jgi:hypothetical protein
MSGWFGVRQEEMKEILFHAVSKRKVGSGWFGFRVSASVQLIQTQ